MSTGSPSPAAGVERHLLLCATPTKALCGDPAVGAASWALLKRLLREAGLEDPGRPQGIVLRTKADCLRVCDGGPILLIWPDGLWYGGVTPERIERIVAEHLLAGRPIDDWVIRRTPFAPTPGGDQRLPCT